jgi:hypothetical protein
MNRHRAAGILRSLVVMLGALGLYICVVRPAYAQECIFPDNVDWVVDQSCEISVIRIAPQNLSVIDGAVLSIESSGELILDMRQFRISVDRDSRIMVAPGGRVRSNQIGPLLVRGTDGGTFGYFLKRVGGPVLDTINPDLSFHPSSAIKTLYMIEALRQVNSGTLNLGATSLTTCPTIITNLGPVSRGMNGATGCPNPYSVAQVNGLGVNCNIDPLVPNSAATCGGSTQNYSLGIGICAMMRVSNNPAANAIQETVGAGDPQTGWNNMLNTAANVIGLSDATEFHNRMGCGGPFSNMQNNQTTLRDLGLLYEQMATNPAVLFPVAPPVPFIFQNTDAYNFMDNHLNEYRTASGTPIPPKGIAAIVDEQAAELGLPPATITRFDQAVRMVHKAGGNPPGYWTLAGWISFPVDGGANTRDYVYGVFINNVTANAACDKGRPRRLLNTPDR